MSDLSERINSLSPEKRALLLQRLKEQTDDATPESRISRRPDSPQPVACSFGQERLWFWEQLAPETPVYHVPLDVRLIGELQTPALEHALAALVERHESLRTTLKTINGQVMQAVADTGGVTLQRLDLTPLPAAAQEAALSRYRQQEAERPFDLQQGPLMRTTLVRLGDREHVLLVTWHHIIVDGWSLGVFLRELAACYDALTRGQSCSLPELPFQYADYALWQRNQAQSGQLDMRLASWRKHLTGAPQILDLPTDRPRPATQSFHGGTCQFTLSPDLTTQLRAMSQREGATLYMTLLAAYEALLYRSTGQRDFLVGTPIANRTQTDTENIIGLFMTTLPLRARLAGNPTFRDLLSQVREECLQAYAHQDIPFEKLVEALQPERSLSHNPLTQALFALQNTTLSPIALPSLRFQPAINHVAGTAKFDLSLELTESPEGGLAGNIEYSADLFDAATIERMAGHYRTLLDGAVAHPDRPVAELPLLTESERRQTLVEWNATDADYPTRSCVHHLFEAQAARTPNAVAVIYEDQQLTYAELDAQANQLAHYLQRLGVGPDVLVGLCVDRSLEMVVGLLGILKAGGAYVPLDPRYPAERLHDMLEDAQVAVTLTQRRLPNMTPIAHGKPVVYIDDWATFAAEPATRPRPDSHDLRADHLCYVIYTSGSTGKPKGVQVEHRAVVNFLTHMSHMVHMASDDALLAVTTLSFDIAALELYLPLTVGGRVVVAPTAALTDGEALAELLRRGRMSIMQATPATWRLLLAAGWSGGKSMKLLCGGEAMPRELASQLVQRGGHVWNVYGPTETTIWSTIYPLDAATLENTSSALTPIGRPIANTQVFVLDAHLQPVPVGTPGELYIGGDGLSRGYLHHPELTAARFIPNPFAGGAQTRPSRLYRTGDIARYLADGNLDFLGRVDHQVKIRGFRIELGEIESVLAQHERVREAVVVAREGPSGDKRLVAYVSPRDGTTRPTSLNTSELRAFLRERLPDYFVPAAFVQLATLPLTPNGKVDRQALPAPDGLWTNAQEGYVAPRTPAERILCDIWADVLHVERVGVHDNFFDLGGDSLLSLQVVAHAAAKGLRLRVNDLFTHARIADLATRITVTATTPMHTEQGLVTGEIPLTPIQHFFFEQYTEDWNHRNVALVLETPPKMDLDILQQTISYLIRRHDALRTRFYHTDSGWRQYIAEPDERTIVSYRDLSSSADGDFSRIIEREATDLHQQLDLEKGPVLRLAYFDLGQGRPGRLLLIVHHLVFDGLSWAIFLEDLETTYRQLQAGVPANLPPKTTSVQYWAQRLQAYARSPELVGDRAYWQRQVQRYPLPLDNPGGSNGLDSVRLYSHLLDEEHTEALMRHIPRQRNIQPHDILLALLAQALIHWTGQPTVAILLTGHGREQLFDDVDLSRTIGWFTTLTPVVFECADIYDPEAALAAIREQIARIPHRGFSYFLLRYLSDLSAIRERLQAQQWPRVQFNYEGQMLQSISRSTLFNATDEPGGRRHSPKGERSAGVILQLFPRIVDGRLELLWEYSSDILYRETVERIAQGYMEHLRALIAHCAEDGG